MSSPALIALVARWLAVIYAAEPDPHAGEDVSPPMHP